MTFFVQTLVEKKNRSGKKGGFEFWKDWVGVGS